MEKGRNIEVICYKHNGIFHRRWQNGVLLFENDDYFIVGSITTKIEEANGSTWYTREPAVTLYAKHDWYNVVCMFKKKGPAFYANIASPTIYSPIKKALVFIDYDLDIRRNTQQKVSIADISEYDINAVKYDYPEKIRGMVERTTLDLITCAKQQTHPFSASFYERHLRFLKDII